MMLRDLKIRCIISFSFFCLIGAPDLANAVQMSCSFVGGSSGAISFINNIDPTLSAVHNGTVNPPLVQFTCTKNNPYTITLSSPNPQTLTSGVNTLQYTLGVAPSATYAGTAIDLFTPSASTITLAQYQNAIKGSYSNSSASNITISWIAPAGSIVATLPINSVTAGIENVCSVTGSPAVNFGAALDASITGPYLATAIQPAIYCTMGDGVTVIEDYGVNKLGTQHRLKSGANYINYNFGFTTPLAGLGGATDIGNSLALSGSIPAGALDNAPAGTYTDTVTLTISY